MKKHMAPLLCALTVLVSCTTLPALAAERHYPISVEEYTYGPLEEPRVNKVYQLSLSDDPGGIPTEDFERNGRRYYLLDLTREDQVGVDTQPYTETVTLDSDTGDLSTILQRLDGEKEETTENRHTGVLRLDHTSVKVEVKGYQTSTRNLSATRAYPGLSDADLELIPKTITDGGRTLTLADVQWANDGAFYTASASYTGTASSRYATGYTVSASYTGEVAKTNCEVVTYTAMFGSEELPPEEAPSGQPDPSQAPDAAPDESAGGPNWLAMLGCAGGAVTLIAAGGWVIHKLMRRRT